MPYATLTTLKEQDFEELLRTCVIMASDDAGPRLLLSPDRKVIRIFRRGSPRSGASAKRFTRNAQRLIDCGIPAPGIEALRRHPTAGLELVVYPWIPGTEIRRLEPGTPKFKKGFELLAGFVALLHHKAITATKSHLGNIILTPSGELSLTDVTEVRWHWLPLNPVTRARALRPLFSDPGDRVMLRSFGIRRFLGIYLLTSGMSRFASALFLRRLLGSI